MRWTLRHTRRLTAAAGLLTILGGVPAGLWQIAGWPLPRRVPTTRAGWQHVLNSGFPDTAVINLLAVALWIVWAAFLYTLWVEWRATRGGTRRRLPRGMVPMQALAALLIAAISTGPVALAAAPSAPMPAVVHIQPGTGPTAVHLPDQPGPRIANLTDVGTGVDRPAAGAAAVSATQVDTGRLPRFAAAGFDGPLRVQVGDQHYTVTVHRGDTLWDIAGAWLGDHARWTEIYHLNAGRYDQHGHMKHGNHIEAGWVLVLPPDARPPAGAQATPAPAPHTSPDTGSATAPAAPSAAPSAAPTPAPSGSSVDDGVIPDPTPTATAAPSSAATTTAPPTNASTDPAPTAPAAAASGDHQGSQHQNNPGIDLPGGGWVAAPVAAAIAAAAALVWIQRRRRYRPRPPTAGRRTDADLVPLPRTVAALHRARPEPTFEDHMDHLAPEAMEAATVTTASLGLHANLPLRLPDLPALGVGLVGPGAHDAARGILAAVLSAGGPWAPGDEATITTTAADLTTLLGADAERHQLDRLHVADTLDEALKYLERHLLRRARLSADRDGTDLTTLHRHPTDQPQPPIMFLAAAPGNTTPIATALSAVLAVGSRLAITGVLLGPWPTGATWHVNADGTTRPDGATDAGGPRLNVLDTTATVDILDTLREARPASNDLPPPPAPPPPASPPRSTPLRTIPSPHSPTAPPHTDHNHVPATPQAVPTTTGSPPAPATNSTSTPGGPRLALTVLGKPALHLTAGDTRTDLRIRRSDGMQILVHLAVEPDGATSDQLMTALWPETRPRYARGRFHTTTSELRQILAEAVGADAIGRTDERYHLQPAHIDVDVWDLTAAAHRAATTVDPTQHTRALRDVINLYTGPVADGHNWLWLAPYRETIRRYVLDAYTGLADTETDPTAALALIQDAIHLDPYNEDIYQRAMRLHATLNNPDGVTRTLRTLTHRLTELEIDASPQTQQVATDLLAKLRARRRDHDHAA